MKITEIKVRKLIDNAGALKAIVSVMFDNELVVHDIRVIEKKNGKLCISMPSRFGADGCRQDIVHPVITELRKEMECKIIETYLSQKQAQV